MTIAKIASSLDNIENKILDPLGYIPVISTISGLGRGCLAIAQVVAALFTAIISLIGITSELNLAGRLFVHGFANLTRAAVEIIPFVGNILTLIYDEGLTSHGLNADSISEHTLLKPHRFTY